MDRTNREMKKFKGKEVQEAMITTDTMREEHLDGPIVGRNLPEWACQ